MATFHSPEIDALFAEFGKDMQRIAHDLAEASHALATQGIDGLKASVAINEAIREAERKGVTVPSQ